MEIIKEETEMTPAEKYYKNHLKNVSTYQKKYPEKMRANNRREYSNLKEKNEEKYKAMLANKKQYYIDHIKPKKLAAKALLTVEETSSEELSELTVCEDSNYGISIHEIMQDQYI